MGPEFESDDGDVRLREALRSFHAHEAGWVLDGYSGSVEARLECHAKTDLVGRYCQME